MHLVLAVFVLCTSLSRAHAAPDPEQSWNRAVEQRANEYKREEKIKNDAIKLQSRAERIQRSLQLASEATGEPPQAFTYKCINDCTLEKSGTATFWIRIALQSRTKVCRYNALDDHNEYATRPAVECLNRVH